MMTTIRKIKIQRQRDQGIIIINNIPVADNKVGDLLSGQTPKMNDQSLKITFNSTTSTVYDGYWITILDWTQCSLKCGGGVSTFQRMCVPPKQGGKPCDGLSILTKPCNVQPCPQVKELKHFRKNMTQAASQKPVVKIMAFSDRPQRYTKCIVKESDMMYTKILTEKAQENIQLPVRIVMNNKTISIFGSSDYNSVIVNFELQETIIARSKMHPHCFILSQGEITDLNLRQAEICPFGMDAAENIYQSWMYDFNLFKYQCNTEKETIDLENYDARALDEKYKKKVSQAKVDIIQETSSLLNEKIKNKDEKSLNQQLIKTNVMAMTAIQKEVSMEDYVKKEEEEREAETEKVMMDQINEEKEKQNCLLKKIQEKEKEDQYNLKFKEAESEIKRIQDQAQKQLVIKRTELKSAILKMRKKAERKKAQLAANLQSVRIQISKDMTLIYKEGDMTKCQDAMKNNENRNSYCGANFPDDFVKFDNCKSEDEDFCSFCCETEFGDMHMDKRQLCYDTLCSSKPTVADPKGNWLWVGDTLKQE